MEHNSNVLKVTVQSMRGLLRHQLLIHVNRPKLDLYGDNLENKPLTRSNFAVNLTAANLHYLLVDHSEKRVQCR